MNISERSVMSSFQLQGKRVWVAGHTGLVGSALVRRLAQEQCQVLTVTHGELDLTRQSDTENWMRRAKPDVVFIAAARVGGIAANARYPVDFLYTNTMIAMNIVRASFDLGVQKLMCMGSSCVYPKHASQPIAENDLLTGSLEPTNEAYAVAKIAAIKLASAYAQQYNRSYISIMPTNLYGQNDNFDLENSHVIPALIRKIHEAKINERDSVVVWGSGSPLREFLHVNDLADACVFLMKRYQGPDLINIGSGQELSIRELAMLIARVANYNGNLVFDASKPDGAPRKLVDSSHLKALGWKPSISLQQGLEELYSRWAVALT